MDRLRQILARARVFAIALATVVVSWAVRWTGRLGIAARLGIAFVAVAILAIAANFFAQRSITIVRTEVHTSPAQSFIEQPQRELEVQLERNALLASIGRLERAVLAHTEGGNAVPTCPLSVAEIDVIAPRTLAIYGWGADLSQ